MNSKTKIKVNRQQLIDAIREREAAAFLDYNERLREYERLEQEYPSQVAGYLAGLAELVREGTVDPSDALSPHGFRSKVPDPPSRPCHPREPRDMSLAIQQLEMAADDTVTISGEDFAAYMR